MSAEATIIAALEEQGLLGLGVFECEGHRAQLMGNVGSSLWPAFSTSDEYVDGRSDPMNRWTQRLVEAAVQLVEADKVREVRYPFGDRVWPFQAYGRKAMAAEQSPIGLLVSQKYGLWTAFRAVIVFNQQWVQSEPCRSDSPCETCSEKPCLNTCPIGAFSTDGHDYTACKSYVASDQGKTCRVGGCLARLACPVGKDYRYLQEHQAFHMRAFVGS
ncbi:MAG: hypothetical protein ACR2O8_02905 [Rhizobiaceae bacterium]